MLKPHNIGISVHQKLRNLSATTGEDFSLLLTRYTLERLLYRISQSEYRQHFILKGAMLFYLWTDRPHRPTRDLDLLGSGDPSIAHCAEVFTALCGVPVEPDGLAFLPESVNAQLIKEGQDYEGVRIKLLAHLNKARISVQVDVGFGDAVTAALLVYPTLLPMQAPNILAYPMNTVIAEKFEAIVSLGMGNSRMKDFYDLWFLARTFSFESAPLISAIHTTFQRRGTTLDPKGLKLLLSKLSTDHIAVNLWRGFLLKNKLAAPADLATINQFLATFLLSTTTLPTSPQNTATWLPGGPWQQTAASVT